MKSIFLMGRNAIVSASLVVLIAGSAHAASASLRGPSESVAPGEVFSVSLAGEGFNPIVGGGASLDFAADLLELLSVEIDSAWTFVPDIGQRDNTRGKLSDMSFNIFPGMQYGSFPIATFEFRAKAPSLAGISLLGSDIFPFGDEFGQEVTVDFNGTQVHIVPEPATWLILSCGIAFVAGIRAARANSSAQPAT